MRRKPSFFIVGAPKSGTTALYEYLRVHPEIFMSPIKEPYYFGSDLVYLNIRKLSESEYLSLFTGATDEKELGEASVTYLVSEQAAQEIQAFNPHAKIIIMLRNPIDMMYSMHSQARFTHIEDIEDFATALSLEAERKQRYNIPVHTTILNFILYRELARYSEQVSRYLQTFGNNRVHVITYDDFERDVAGVYQRILQFLNVDDSFQPKSFKVVNKNKIRRNEWINSILNKPVIVKSVRVLLPSYPLRQYLAQKLTSFTVNEVPRVPMSHTLRKQLQLEFLPEVQKLSSLLGIDLTRWCKE